ncbi:hypothetical protein M0804_009803 [Polistes exclamans]|nr:hypothetical protein M0804_009803 [Polistes exclamans]
MAEYKLAAVVRLIWENHQRGKSIQNTAAELLSNGSFKFPGVSEVAVKYWFHFFYENPDRFDTERCHIFVTPAERLAFLSVLLNDHPYWTVAHFKDAIKVSGRRVLICIDRLDYYYCHEEQMWRKYP